MGRRDGGFGGWRMLHLGEREALETAADLNVVFDQYVTAQGGSASRGSAAPSWSKLRPGKTRTPGPLGEGVRRMVGPGPGPGGHQTWIKASGLRRLSQADGT